MKPDSLTIRVYGLLMHEGKVLLSRENIKGEIYTKFPGGGLELGEGIIACLKREFMEEAAVQISEAELFYVNEDFLPSAFHPSTQVVVIYYLVKSSHAEKVTTADPDAQHLLQTTGSQVLYWCELENLQKQPVHLPIDKVVIHKLLTHT